MSIDFQEVAFVFDNIMGVGYAVSCPLPTQIDD